MLWLGKLSVSGVLLALALPRGQSTCTTVDPNPYYFRITDL